MPRRKKATTPAAPEPIVITRTTRGYKWVATLELIDPAELAAEKEAAAARAAAIQRDVDALSEQILEAWPLVVKVCRQREGPKIPALLRAAEPIRLDPGDPPMLVVAVAYRFHRDLLREPANRTAVEWALEQVLGCAISVLFIQRGSKTEEAS